MPKKNKIPCLPSKRGNKLPNTELISDKCGTLDTMNSHLDWNKNRPGLRLLFEMYCSAGIKSPQSPRAKWNLPEVSEKLVITVRTGWVGLWYKHHLSGYLDSSCLSHAVSLQGALLILILWGPRLMEASIQQVSITVDFWFLVSYFILRVWRHTFIFYILQVKIYVWSKH